MYIIACQKCGQDVERTINISSATCFKCKKRNQNKYMSDLYAMERELRIIKEQTKRAEDPRPSVLRDNVHIMEVKKNYKGVPV